jgi:PEP-CTERM motif-containing protein
MSARPFRVCVISALLVLGAARSSTAEPIVIYSNFGPEPGYVVENWDPFGTHVWDTSDEHLYMMGFQLDQAAQLTSVMLPIVWGRQIVAGVNVRVWRSSDGMPVFGSGGLVETVTIPTPGDAQPFTASMLSGQSIAQPLLDANTLYFLYVFPTSALWHVKWPWNNAGVSGPVVLSSPGGVAVRTGQLSAFQLNGNLDPVPEPATMVLFATGAGLVLQRVRRRRV